MITARGDLWDMQHFFVMRKYRHRGLGSELARRVWCEHPGPWEVRVVENNDAALRFWSNVVKREGEVLNLLGNLNGVHPVDAFEPELDRLAPICSAGGRTPWVREYRHQCAVVSNFPS
jgi:ribosomal protein S18 acetylase RimI-like enzyme